MEKATKSKKTKSASIEKKEKFISFVFQKDQKWDWLILVASCLIGYIFLRYWYPYPATMSDSGGYVAAAMSDRFSFYRPFGYSYFLQLIHFISSGIGAVFIIQMLLYFISTAVFAFTIKYFFRPFKNWIWYVLLFFLACSPLAFFMANSLMSDLLFSVMIYFMLSAFVFIIMKKSWVALIFFCLSLFCTLHIRYSAIIFPIVFIPFLFMIKHPIKWVSVVLSLFLTLVFYGQMKENMRKTTKFNQFSTGFDGWQLANNALHVVPFIDLQPSKIKNSKVRDFHEFVVDYKDSILVFTENGSKVSAAFLWNNALPLKVYLRKTMAIRNQSYPNAWIYLGANDYKEYGTYIISHYPFKFMRYYFLPNSLNIFYPRHTGIIAKYVNINPNYKEIFEWYNIPEDQNLDARNDVYGKFLTRFILISNIFIWVFIVGVSVLAIFKRKYIRFTKEEKITFWGLFVFAAIYYASTVFASPIEFRYWLPMASIQFAFCYILINKLSADIFSHRKSIDT